MGSRFILEPTAANKHHTELNPPKELQSEFTAQRCCLACPQLRSWFSGSVLEIIKEALTYST